MVGWSVVLTKHVLYEIKELLTITQKFVTVIVIILIITVAIIVIIIIIILIVNTPQNWEGIFCPTAGAQLSVRKDNSWPMEVERLAR